jgi:hypothetical protein
MNTKNLVTVTVTYPIGSLGPKSDPVRQTARAMQITVPPGEDTIELLDNVWRVMNRVDGSAIERQLNEYGERSMMVGDYVTLSDGRSFRCDVVGWAEYHPPRITEE